MDNWKAIAACTKAHLIPLITVTVTKDVLVPTQMTVPTAYVKKTWSDYSLVACSSIKLKCNFHLILKWSFF